MFRLNEKLKFKWLIIDDDGGENDDDEDEADDNLLEMGNLA